MHIRGQLVPTIRQLSHWPRFRLRLFFEGTLVGIVSGLIISLFRWALEQGTALRISVYTVLQQGGLPENIAWFLLLIAAGYLLHRTVVYEPDAGGSGIPQVKGVISGVIRMRWLRILWVKLFSGVLGIGLGLSLGREGPSIQIGAVTAQGISRFFGRTRMEERYLITAGASAGLAAAFNAPLAGVIFALEELHRNFSGVVLAPAMAAALMATMVCRFIFGKDSIFQFGMLPHFPLRYMWIALIVGLVAAFLGQLFNKGLLSMSKFYGTAFFRSGWTRVSFALVTAGVLGYILPDVLGGGNDLINRMHEMGLSLGLFLLLLIGKYLFTFISYGCGVPGGFFLPMLVLGALSGSVVGICLIQLGLMEPAYLSNIVVISMAAFFTASVHSPITGTILIMEMTNSYDHLLVLCTASLIALIAAKLGGGEPIYDVLLQRLLKKGGPSAIDDGERNIFELTVASGSRADGRFIGHIEWPGHVALIDVKRGHEEIVPDNKVRLQAGDYIYILTDSPGAAEAVRSLVEKENA